MQSSKPSGSDDSNTYTEEDAEKLWNIPPPPSQPSRLSLPVCVPQLTGKFDSPFVRGYCKELAEVNVTLEDWLSFCDGLNIAMVASPPLRVVGMAGNLLGFVPYHWMQVASQIMQTGAQAGIHVLSKTLTERFLRRARKRFFEPRGLSVRICKTLAMRQLIGLDAIPDEQPNKAKEVAQGAGRAVENLALELPIPFAGRIVEAVSRPVPQIDANSPLDATGRRLAELEGHAAPLDCNVPPSKTPDGVMDQMSELAVKLSRKLATRTDLDATQKRQTLAIREGRSSGSGSACDTGGGPVEKIVKSLLQDDEGTIAALDENKDNRLRRKVAKADRVEYNMTEAALWIVVLNADEDRTVDQTRNNGQDDEEVVGNSEWDEEIEREDGEFEVGNGHQQSTRP